MLQIKKSARGFTVIELMFAMTFLAVLLIILLVSVIQITRTYNKGVTLKRVDQSGRNIGQEVQQAIQQAGSTAVYVDGKLCLGDYSFVWSQPATSINGHTVDAIDNKYDDGHDTPVGFAKVKDATLCDSPTATQIPKSQSIELLGDGLVMRQPTELIADQDNNRLLTFKYTISTPDDGGGVFSFLSPTEDELHCTGDSGDEFCALSTFVVTAYAKGL